MQTLASTQLPGTTLLIEETIRQAVPFAKAVLANGTVHITIEDPNGVVLVSNDVMTNISIGRYAYNYFIPLDAILGIYTVYITATIGTNTGRISDTFEVVASGE